MSVKLLTEHHLEFLSLNGGCTGSSVATLVKMPHCRKLHVAAQIIFNMHTLIYRSKSSHKLWKSWKITRKKSMHGKIMEFEIT